jgi:amino acid adenylation domain-containing protein
MISTSMRNPIESISPTQKTIWIKQNLFADSSFFNVGGYLELKGSLNTSILVKAFKILFENSDIFSLLRPLVSKSINKEMFKCISVEDFSSTENSAETIIEWMKKDMRIKMDLSECLVEIHVIKANKELHFCYFKGHHILMDGFAFEIAVRRASEIYKALINGQKSANYSEFKFGDYLDEYYSYSKSEEFYKDKNYWFDKLNKIEWNRGFSSVCSPQKKKVSAKRKEVVFERSAFNAIGKFCTENNFTIFHYFTSAICILNQLYNNESFIMGLPVFNRRNHKQKNTFGVFINIIPFYIEMDAETIVTEVLRKVKDETRSCYRHQKFPLIDLHDDLKLSGNYFNILFSYQKIEYKSDLYDCRSKAIYLSNGQQEEDLIFHLIEFADNENVVLAFDYKEEAFAEEILNNLISDFIHLLNYLHIHSSEKLGEISFVSERDGKQISEFNNTNAIMPDKLTFIDLFEAVAFEHPDRLAVVCNQNELTYSEINKRSNRLAHYLRNKCDVKPDDIIGIKLERDESFLVTILAIMKAGGAYLPFDISYPEERIAQIYESSGCVLILDQSKLSLFEKSALDYPATNPAKVNLPSHLAYVIYTSGSTGNPKGSMIEHSGMLNHLLAMKEELGLELHSKIAQNAAPTFDISVWQFLNALIVGGTTVMLDNDTILNPAHFIKNIKFYQVSILQVVPSYLKSILEYCSKTGLEPDFTSLKYLSVTGEAVNTPLLQEWFAKFPDIKIVNAYGPAEASDDVTLHILEKAPDDINVPVGKPIRNVKIYILDKAMRQCPIGIEGEIYVAGIAVSRGYINKEEKGNSNFMDDPFLKNKGRMYRTGDMGRWRQDGIVEFLGRRDDQVKIRGHRIELEEINNTLLKIPEIKNSIVIARDKINEEKCLVAYLVADTPLNFVNLRNQLALKVPLYMMPSFFVQMDELPLSNHGKIDKKKLPEPEDYFQNNEMKIVLPANETEQELLLIWKEVLNLTNISTDANFFELGGHSLKAMKVIARVYEQFEVKMEMSYFFDQPNIQSIAKYLEASKIIESKDINHDASVII